jgi:SAM-dependent methyltransferase
VPDATASLSAAWEKHARAWAAWARTPGHDVFFTGLNWPAFRELLPPPGRRTLDVGCGEGRVGRELAAIGHDLAGIDSAPTLVALAREGGGYGELVCGSAARLPWAPGSFDLVVAFMSMHDMDDPVAAIDEIGRVLEPGGVLCLAITHPLNRLAEASKDYFREQRFSIPLAWDGIEMVFEGIDRPLETYTGALSGAGFVIERLVEPRAAASTDPGSALAKAITLPFFLHMRCRLDRVSRS